MNRLFCRESVNSTVIEKPKDISVLESDRSGFIKNAFIAKIIETEIAKLLWNECQITPPGVYQITQCRNDWFHNRLANDVEIPHLTTTSGFTHFIIPLEGNGLYCKTMKNIFDAYQANAAHFLAQILDMFNPALCKGMGNPALQKYIRDMLLTISLVLTNLKGFTEKSDNISVLGVEDGDVPCAIFPPLCTELHGDSGSDLCKPILCRIGESVFELTGDIKPGDIKEHKVTRYPINISSCVPKKMSTIEMKIH